MGDITAVDLKSVLNHWMEQGYAYTTVKKVHILLNEYFRYLTEESFIQKNLMQSVPMMKKSNFLAAQDKMCLPEQEQVTVFTPTEIATFKREAFSTFANGKRKYQQAAAYILMLNTGLRTGELLRLLNSDIDLQNRVLCLERGVKEVWRRDGLQAEPGRDVKVGKLIDTGHLHNHLIVNSVSCVDGRKLHQNAADLQHHRDVNDQICMKYHLSVLPKPQKHSRKKRMEPGEYQAGLRGDSWKLELVFVLNQALREAEDKESFIEYLEREGYQVRWSANRKHITFITPEGYRCRDTSLHDETFLKDNLEYLFLYRQLTNFEPGREEPSYGWLYGVTYNAEALIRYMEQAMNVPDPPPVPVWTESKQRQREALKKLAHGQRLENTENFEEDEGYSFGMSM